MFDNYTTTYNQPTPNSMEVAMRAREQDKKMTQLMAGYYKASRNQSKQNRRSLRQMVAALITNLR